MERVSRASFTQLCVTCVNTQKLTRLLRQTTLLQDYNHILSQTEDRVAEDVPFT